MATGNIEFLFDTVTDRPGVTLTASSEASALLGVANLKDLRPGKRWAAGGIASEHVLIDAGAGKALDFDTLAFVAHNGDVEGLVETIVSDNADLSASAVSRTDELWRPTYGLGEQLGLYLGGYPVLSRLADFTPLTTVRLDAQASGRYCRVRFVNPNNPALQFRLGRIMAGLAWRASRNFRYGWSYKWVDLSQVRDTDGGSFIGSRKVKVREFTLSIGSGSLPLNECLSYADDLLRIVGNTRAVLMQLFPAGTVNRVYRTSVYARFVGQAAIVGEHAELGSVAQIVARELR